VKRRHLEGDGHVNVNVIKKEKGGDDGGGGSKKKRPGVS
jgi:hypothetical protein